VVELAAELLDNTALVLFLPAVLSTRFGLEVFSASRVAPVR